MVFSKFGMESFLLLCFSVIIPLEIVKVLLWEELKTKAWNITESFDIFHVFHRSKCSFFLPEWNKLLLQFVLSCTDSCQGREESMRSWVSRLTTIVLWICSAFGECLHWGLTMVLDDLPSQDTFVRTALRSIHIQLFSPWYHFTFSTMSAGKTALKRAGSWHGALVLWLVVRKLLLSHCDVSGAYKWIPATLLQ